MIRPLWRIGIGGLLCVLTFSVRAEWIQASGQAVVMNGQTDLAREQARKEALREASYKFGAKIQSQSRVQAGRLVSDTLDIQTSAIAREIKVVNERVEGGVVRMDILADMVEKNQSSCPSTQANGYKKKLAIIGFSMASPQQASLGKLYDVERKLPSTLTNLFQSQGHLQVFETSHLRFYDELTNAPTSFSQRKTITKAVKLAAKMGAQFVMSGIVRDMSVNDPSAFKSSRLLNVSRFWGFADRTRHFAVDVYIHDGFSGEILYQQRFETQGLWNADPEAQVGFASPEFWKTDYGQEVAKVLQDITNDTGEVLRCQPFMSRITRVAGRELQFDAGANAGIRPGDKLAVYRALRVYSGGLLQNTELTNVKAAFTVSQVHPGFSTGKMMVNAGQLNIQQDDLLIAW